MYRKTAAKKAAEISKKVVFSNTVSAICVAFGKFPPFVSAGEGIVDKDL